MNSTWHLVVHPLREHMAYTGGLSIDIQWLYCIFELAAFGFLLIFFVGTFFFLLFSNPTVVLKRLLHPSKIHFKLYKYL